MDPISQGIVGAVAVGVLASAKISKRHLRTALGLGLLAGLAPDLDVFIQSATDPMLGLEYHRHFTHALPFVPLGALLTAGALYFLYARFKLSFMQTYWCCFIGYATHGLLDSCTTYGTYLLWPFSNARISWSVIAIVDPLFTVPIALLLLVAVCKKAKRFAAYAALWGLLYLAFGGWQGHRAETAGLAVAHSRGHVGERLSVIPAPGSLLLWKSIYQHQDFYYVDGVRTGVRVAVWRGDCIEKFSRARHMPWLNPDSQQHRDIARFRRFANGYIAPSNFAQNVVVDMRYSSLPHSVQSLWGIRLSPNKADDEHVDYFHEHPHEDEDWEAFIGMLKGEIPQPGDGSADGDCS